jgi:hypothetical protein
LAVVELQRKQYLEPTKCAAHTLPAHRS